MKLFAQYRGLRKEIYVLFFSKIITCMGSMIWSMMTIILSTKLDFTPTQISMWMIGYNIIGMPLTLLGGKLVDRLDKKKIIIYSDLIEVITYTICFLLPISKLSIIIVLITSAIESFSGSAYDVLVADLSSSQDRQRADSLIYLGINIGMLLTPTLAGLLVKDHLNLMFLITASTTFIALVIEWIYLKDCSVNYSQLSEYEAPQEGKDVLKVFMDNKPIIFFIISCTIMWQIYYQYSFVVPLELTKVYGEDGSVIYGIMSSINCLTVVAFTTIMTKLTSKFFDLHRTMLAVILYGIGMAIISLFITDKFMCYLAYFIFTLGEVLATISNSTIITKRIPATHRGRVLSIMSFAGSIVYAISEGVVANIYEHFGANITFNIIIGASIFVAIILFVLVFFDKKRYPNLYNVENKM